MLTWFIGQKNLDPSLALNLFNYYIPDTLLDKKQWLADSDSDEFHLDAIVE